MKNKKVKLLRNTDKVPQGIYESLYQDNTNYYIRYNDDIHSIPINYFEVIG